VLFSSTLGIAKWPYEIRCQIQLPSVCCHFDMLYPKWKSLGRWKMIWSKRASLDLENPLTQAPPFLCQRVEEVSGWWWIIRRLIQKLFSIRTLCRQQNKLLRKFSSAVAFSVLDLNSAYYQIPLSVQNLPVDCLLQTIWPSEFNKLPMGISMGCQG
jgi:hypothetical protein